MRKYLIWMTGIMLLFTAVLPCRVQAAESRETIEFAADGQSVAVKLGIPRAAGERISSLRLRLNVKEETPGTITDASFQFHTAALGNAKVTEARYSKESGILNIYIAGTENLFKSSDEILLLGKISVSDRAGNSVPYSVSVPEEALEIPGGMKAEKLSFENAPEIRISTGSQEMPGGNKNDGQLSVGGNLTAGSAPGGKDVPDSPKEEDFLQQAVDAAKGYTPDGFTTKSFSSLNQAVENAEAVLERPDAGEEEKEEALQDLQNAVGALEDKTSSAEGEDGQKGTDEDQGEKKASRRVPVLGLVVVLCLLAAAAVTYVVTNRQKRSLK